MFLTFSFGGRGILHAESPLCDAGVKRNRCKAFDEQIVMGGNK